MNATTTSEVITGVIALGEDLATQIEYEHSLKLLAILAALRDTLSQIESEKQRSSSSSDSTQDSDSE